MIDLHCHLLPGLDDGPASMSEALQMARLAVADGVRVVVCTPHIRDGRYPNSPAAIRTGIAKMRAALDEAGIPLGLVCGADNHISKTFVEDLRSDRRLPIADSRYVLVETPGDVVPVRLHSFFFEIALAGYVPIYTHPERLSWVHSHYSVIGKLVSAGVWMQITAGSLAGAFGPKARSIALRMLDDGLVHLIASDAHDTKRRPPNLSLGRELARKRVGEEEAWHLVATRPQGVLANASPSSMPPPKKPRERLGQTHEA